MNSTLFTKTCLFQGSCERTRAEVKLMPAADVHKLGSIALHSVKTKKICITPPRTPVPTIAQNNTGTAIRISKIIFTTDTQTKLQRDLSHLPRKLQLDMPFGRATGYWLDGPGFDFRWGRVFPHPSSPALGPT
jgi:hypothetical protein